MVETYREAAWHQKVQYKNEHRNVLPLWRKSSLRFSGKNCAARWQKEWKSESEAYSFSMAITLCNPYVFDNGRFKQKSYHPGIFFVYLWHDNMYHLDHYQQELILMIRSKWQNLSNFLYLFYLWTTPAPASSLPSTLFLNISHIISINKDISKSTGCQYLSLYISGSRLEGGKLVLRGTARVRVRFKVD